MSGASFARGRAARASPWRTCSIQRSRGSRRSAARIAFPLEITLGALFALTSLLNAQWWGGLVNWWLNVGFAIVAGLAVALHRIRPSVALAFVPAIGVGLFLGAWVRSFR